MKRFFAEAKCYRDTRPMSAFPAPATHGEGDKWVCTELDSRLIILFNTYVGLDCAASAKVKGFNSHLVDVDEKNDVAPVGSLDDPVFVIKHWHNVTEDSKSGCYSINDITSQCLWFIYAKYKQNRPSEGSCSMLHVELISRKFELEAVPGPGRAKDRFTAPNKLYGLVLEIIDVWGKVADGSFVCLEPTHRYVVFVRTKRFKIGLPITLAASQFCERCRVQHCRSFSSNT